MDTRINAEWARSVQQGLAEQRRELLSVSDRSQIEEALLADASLDWALTTYLLEGPSGEVRAALLEAGQALVNVHALRGTSVSPPVVRVDDDGLYVSPPAGDESLDSPERARIAYHLAGVTQDGDLLDRTRWPGGGSAAEEAALAALHTSAGDRFLAALHQVLEEHTARVPDPRVLISVPALGLTGRALARNLVLADALPAHPALPLDLLTT